MNKLLHRLALAYACLFAKRAILILPRRPGKPKYHQLGIITEGDWEHIELDAPAMAVRARAAATDRLLSEILNQLPLL